MCEHCRDCSEEYADFGVYLLPDELWAQLAPEWAPGGLLCPRCLERRAEEQGHTLYWTAALDDFPFNNLGPQVSVDPGLRVKLQGWVLKRLRERLAKPPAGRTPRRGFESHPIRCVLLPCRHKSDPNQSDKRGVVPAKEKRSRLARPGSLVGRLRREKPHTCSYVSCPAWRDHYGQMSEEQWNSVPRTSEQIEARNAPRDWE